MSSRKSSGWVPLVVGGKLNGAIKAAIDHTSGAYAVRTKRGHGVVYVGESHVGRMWRTLCRHFQADSFRGDLPRFRRPEDYEVKWEVTSRGARSKDRADQAAMDLQAAWIARLAPVRNKDDGLAEVETHVCGECHGEGETLAGDRCSACAGSGRVAVANPRRSLTAEEKRKLRALWRALGVDDAREGKRSQFTARGAGKDAQYTFTNRDGGTETGGGPTFPDREVFGVVAKAYLAGFSSLSKLRSRSGRYAAECDFCGCPAGCGCNGEGCGCGVVKKKSPPASPSWVIFSGDEDEHFRGSRVAAMAHARALAVRKQSTVYLASADDENDRGVPVMMREEDERFLAGNPAAGRRRFDAPFAPGPTGALVELGVLTRLVVGGGAGELAWNLRDAPVLAYDGGGRLFVVYVGRVVRAASPAEVRSYDRTHWGRSGRGTVRDGGIAPEPVIDLGPAVSITYTTKKGGDASPVDYVHPFGEGSSRRCIFPRVVEHRCAGGCSPRCAARGALALVGGSYRVESRGIVG